MVMLYILRKRSLEKVVPLLSSFQNADKFPRKKIEIGARGLEQKRNGPLDQTSSLNAELVKEDINTIDNERGQVLQIAQVVMNMFDTMCPEAEMGEAKLRNLKNGRGMVGAVTVVLGASAFLVHQQDSEKGNATSKSLSKSSKEKGNHQREPDNL